MELEVGLDLSTPMRQTGTIEIEGDLGVTGEIEVNADIGGFGLGGDIEIDAEVDAPEIELEIEVDLGIELSVDVEIDLGFDINVWGAPKSTPPKWTGWFATGDDQNEMILDNLDIGFDGIMSGGGSDGVGGFTIDGSMDGKGAFTFNKAYEGAHTVIYTGNLEGSALKGTWSIPDNADGDFEIKLDSAGWNGWFEQGGDKKDMELDMSIGGDAVFGSGVDAVGSFIVRGTFDEGSGDCNFAKQYIGQHQVLYFGKNNGQAVRGKWTIPDNCEGKFKLTKK